MSTKPVDALMFQKSVDVMRSRRIARLLIGATLIVGPWIWGIFAIVKDPSQGDAQGAFTLATYQSMIATPLGIALIAFSLRTPKSR